jgi:hypothetical protein
MRKMFSSGKTSCKVLFSAWAEARSRPKGFSTITRAFPQQLAAARFFTTAGNMLGGMAR